MAATVITRFDFGGTDAAPGTEQDVTGLGPPMVRMKQADNATIDNLNPVPVPTAGTNYSYWKHIYFEASAGTWTQIDNVKIYTDGTGFGTGITLNVGDQNPTKTSVSNAGYEVADGADDMVGGTPNHSLITTKTSLFTYTTGSPRSCTISEAGSIIDAIGESTNYIVIQIEVITTATAGDLVDENITWRYDEI